VRYDVKGTAATREAHDAALLLTEEVVERRVTAGNSAGARIGLGIVADDDLLGHDALPEQAVHVVEL
jgi:hypothetical protein